MLRIRSIAPLVLLFFAFSSGYAQTTCTISGTVNWNNASPPSCAEGGTATGKAILRIPAGATINFNSNGDTWSGTKIEVYGTLLISFSVTINSSVVVFNGGVATLGAKLDLGTSATVPAGCNYTLTIFSGGTVDVGGTGSDRLTICGTELMKGNGACNSCLGTNSGQCAYNGNPYCEPAGGFQGPLGYSNSGYNGTLPITLLYFAATLQDQEIALDWATAAEEDFDRFVIERSHDGLAYTTIGEVPGAGTNLYTVVSKYQFLDSDPLLGFNYYRLKAIDLDGSFTYHGVQVVKLKGAKEVSVYPNPTAGATISFDINFNPSENDQVILVNSFGVELMRQPVKSFDNQLVFTHDLSPGVYMLKYLSNNFEKTTRLVVSR